MSFKYNDKLVIKDRQQMEDLFKYRLNLFDASRTKKINLTNNLDTVLVVVGEFNRSRNSLNLVIYDADKINKIPDNDINLVIRPGNIAEIELIVKVNDDVAL